MSPEDRLLFTCTRQRFSDTYRARALALCNDNDIDWHYVYDTAFVQGVAPLVAKNLLSSVPNGLPVPREMFAQWLMCRQQSMDIAEDRDEILLEALSYFKERGIDVMLVKGGALDLLVYRESWYTQSEDIDIILRIRKEDLTNTSDEEIVHLFRPLIEHDYFEHHDLNLNKLLPIDFQDLWDRAEKFQYKEHEIFLLSPEDMLISVCVNSFRKRFFNLKNLCDVAEVVEKIEDLKIDPDKLIELARLYKCENIVFTALLIAHKYLDCTISAEIASRIPINMFKAGIIRYLAGHQSFSTLARLHEGSRIFGRKVNPAVLLPGAVYRWDQILTKLIFVWKSRKLAEVGWHDGMNNLGTDLSTRRRSTML